MLQLDAVVAWIGALTRSQLDRGTLAAELRKLAERTYRPPGRRATKRRSRSGIAVRRAGLEAVPTAVAGSGIDNLIDSLRES